jgi:hypothetical protein
MQARFEHALAAGRQLHPHWRLGASYGGFAAALARQSPALIEGVKRRFRRCAEALPGPPSRVRGWRAFAADGTRIEAPHTLANETGLGCAGRDKTAPQVFLTSLWDLGRGAPWDFVAGPGTDSERRHLEALLPSLPPGSLLVADAGFCGYELCRGILAAGLSLLFRVGGNVTLLTDLGWHIEERDDLVYLWPQKLRSQPPLVLRLIVLRRAGQAVHLLTDVLDRERLSEADAAALYELRWGVEVGYRSYKQTLDRRVLKSRTPANCLVEAQWTMIGLWLLGLLCTRRQGANPRRWSPASARNVVRRALRQATCRRGRSLDQQLRSACRDRYVRRRPKAARNYPQKKRERPPGPPKIKSASAKQRQQAQQLQRTLALAA